MSPEPLRATVAARRLGMPTSELLRLIHDRQIRYVMVDGIAHVPDDAIVEYQDERGFIEMGSAAMSDAEVLRPAEAAQRLRVRTLVVIEAMYERPASSRGQGAASA
ncbi:MAG TPA: hypothetical protein VIR30_16170 [Nocardioides sp.]